MSLRKKQSLFAFNFALLVIFAYENNYEITYGEGSRTLSQQILYFFGFKVIRLDGWFTLVKAPKRTKTFRSKHLQKLAHDINLFYNGQLCTDIEQFRPLAEYWSSLHPDNVSGTDWAWDLGHFQMN